MNWREPTREMLAALALAKQCANKGGLSEIQLAEWIMTAKESLWYFQAMRWKDQAPTEVAADSRRMFREGCLLVTRIVDLGYDAERGQWWPIRKLFESEDEWGGAMLVLMDLGMMMKRLPDVASYPEGTHREEVILGTVQRGFPVVSAGFQVFVSMMCGPRWERQYEAMMKAMEQAQRLGTGRRRR